MKIIGLYRYTNSDGSISITPEKRAETDIEYQYRLIADEDKLITDGEKTFYCIDTANVEQFSEIDKPNDGEAVNVDVYQKAAAYDHLTGRTESETAE